MKLRPTAASNNSLVPLLSYVSTKIKFDYKLFKTRRITFTHKIWIIHQINLSPFTVDNDFELAILLLAAKLKILLILININVLNMVLDLMHMGAWELFIIRW